MFPVDATTAHTTITSSEATTRRIQFYDDVGERDGRQCVLTGRPELCCDAVHLLARSKGDGYIANYTQRRSRDPTGRDIIMDIDSVRNGLFLDCGTHRALGIDVAFLMMPNFAMTMADVDPTAPPTENRYTAPLFTLKDELNMTWKVTFKPGGVKEESAAVERTRHQGQGHSERYEARTAPDTFDMLMTLPYILVPRNELKAMLKEEKEKAEAAERRRVQEKVDSWMKQISAP
ncbi:hypothetical protein HYPSUDRAFT_202865 [Hypholoma sublateritium FD-334 SS-4]|uniref:HNH nuclease domain-containing protein n=1 Tax=Hypholoma sublateritium (strain FD-334 SS-4) TaxID=945553 RepID=A0A0D2L3Y5_HYPSF|nr:hypothetical protein HYPSUDRAFT_202865 [Hypholoma sublateritium FD-334 SS-4]